MTAEELRTLEVSCRLQGKSLVDELRLVESAKRYTYRDANSAFIDMRAEAIREATRKIDASLEAESAEVKRFHLLHQESEQDVHDALIAENLQTGCLSRNNDYRLTVGTKNAAHCGAI